MTVIHVVGVPLNKLFNLSNSILRNSPRKPSSLKRCENKAITILSVSNEASLIKEYLSKHYRLSEKPKYYN